jgi:hypothetical protein
MSDQGGSCGGVRVLPPPSYCDVREMGTAGHGDGEGGDDRAPLILPELDILRCVAETGARRCAAYLCSPRSRSSISLIFAKSFAWESIYISLIFFPRVSSQDLRIPSVIR